MAFKINKEVAKILYKESPDWFKSQLAEAFGEECFKKRNFSDIKTIEDACDEAGISHDSIFDSAKDSPDEIAYKKLKVVVKAINGDWVPDWSNSNQYKYYPYFKVLPSGFGFSASTYGTTDSGTFVGSRLCFESREKSDYAAKQFNDLYKQFLL